jgi:hypothetical protein
MTSPTERGLFERVIEIIATINGRSADEMPINLGGALRQLCAEHEQQLAAAREELRAFQPVEAIAAEDMDEGYDKRYGKVLVATFNSIETLYRKALTAPLPEKNGS